jgi:hypothetical protein
MVQFINPSIPTTERGHVDMKKNFVSKRKMIFVLFVGVILSGI